MCQQSSQAPGNKTKYSATVSHGLEMALENCGLCQYLMGLRVQQLGSLVNFSSHSNALERYA